MSSNSSPTSPLLPPSELSIKYNLFESPIEHRMSALFDCRKLGDSKAVNWLLEALEFDKQKTYPSILFQHEIAYVLGQIGNEIATNKLMELLSDEDEEEMVRHEAAEALAAIGSRCAVDCIQKFVNDMSIPVKQTCELAVQSLIQKTSKFDVNNTSTTCDNNTSTTHDNNTSTTHDNNTSTTHDNNTSTTHDNNTSTTHDNNTSTTHDNNTSTTHDNNTSVDVYPNRTEGNPFTSVDPVPAKLNCTPSDIPSLESILLNESNKLWDRYESLFTLRNLNTTRSISSISRALLSDRGSALLRHEAAFVLGQLQHASSIDALVGCLKNEEEHGMSRHEAALALGAVVCRLSGDDSEEERGGRRRGVEALIEGARDREKVVSESCVVALHNIREEFGVEEVMSIFDVHQTA